MHAMQILFWEQWRQSRLWIAAAYAFLIMLIAAVALYRPWMLAQFYGDAYPLDKFAWALGVTFIGMLFVDQRLRDVSLHFPRRLFALPCPTVPLVVSQLVYRSAVAILMGLLISLFHSLLLAEHPLSFFPILLLLALVAIGQAVSMIATAFGAKVAAVSGWIGLALAFVIYGFLHSLFRLSEEEAARAASLVTALAGWSVAMAVAPVSRHGLARQPFRWRRSGTAALSIKAPLILEWNFATPAWAHTWYEWRRVTGWSVRFVVPTMFLLAVGVVFLDAGGLTILGFGACVVGVLAVCNYFLLRVSSTEHRFLLSRPGGEKAVVNGKLLAALLASLCVAGATVLILAGVAVITILLKDIDTGVIALRIIPIAFVVVGGLMWIVLTSASVYFFLFIVGFSAFLLLAAPLAVATDLGIDTFVVLPVWLLGLALVLYGIGRALRRRGIPIPWELGLALVALLPDGLKLVASHLYYIDLPLPGRVDDRIGFLLPTLVLLGTLFLGLRLKLLSEHRAVFAFVGHLLFSSIVFALYMGGLRYGPLSELDVIFFWVAALFAPLIWIPLAVRLQRYR